MQSASASATVSASSMPIDNRGSADDASALCSDLYERENGPAIVNGLCDLVEQKSVFAQADALFALSWLFHIDAAERIALQRKLIPRTTYLLEKQVVYCCIIISHSKAKIWT